MMRRLAATLFGLTLGGLAMALPAAAQDTRPEMPQTMQQGSGAPAGLLPGSYTPASEAQPARGSEQPAVPGGDHTAAVPVSAETATSAPGNGMVLGGSDARAALPEMQVPTRPGEGKGTLQ